MSERILPKGLYGLAATIVQCPYVIHIYENNGLSKEENDQLPAKDKLAPTPST